MKRAYRYPEWTGTAHGVGFLSEAPGVLKDTARERDNDPVYSEIHQKSLSTANLQKPASRNTSEGGFKNPSRFPHLSVVSE